MLTLSHGTNGDGAEGAFGVDGLFDFLHSIRLI